mmetsp:Transcript_12408/g.39248  ORF Transcript_12408/g.39248 Transcript_12408/m.39248 type:complete len:225 (+) Transcript_12408:451-1125(+)
MLRSLRPSRSCSTSGMPKRTSGRRRSSSRCFRPTRSPAVASCATSPTRTTSTKCCRRATTTRARTKTPLVLSQPPPSPRCTHASWPTAGWPAWTLALGRCTGASCPGENGRTPTAAFSLCSVRTRPTRRLTLALPRSSRPFVTLCTRPRSGRRWWAACGRCPAGPACTIRWRCLCGTSGASSSPTRRRQRRRLRRTRATPSARCSRCPTTCPSTPAVLVSARHG